MLPLVSLQAKVQIEKNELLNELKECALSCAQLCLGRADPFGCAAQCGVACGGGGGKPAHKRNTVNAGGSVLGSFLALDAVQHVGITVENLERSTDFFVRVLGGALVPGAGGPGWQGLDVFNLLEQYEQLDARERGVTLRDEKVAMLNASDTLAAVYISFGNVFVELLEYSARDGAAERAESWMPALANMSSSPSIVNNMHLSFQLNRDVDIDEFVETFERESASAGFPEVACNRIVPVRSNAERLQLGRLRKFNAYKVTDDSSPFRGWTLAYCKGVAGASSPMGPGVQLEFNVVLDRAADDFEQGFLNYLKSK